MKLVRRGVVSWVSFSSFSSFCFERKGGCQGTEGEEVVKIGDECTAKEGEGGKESVGRTCFHGVVN